MPITKCIIGFSLSQSDRSFSLKIFFYFNDTYVFPDLFVRYVEAYGLCWLRLDGFGVGDRRVVGGVRLGSVRVSRECLS